MSNKPDMIIVGAGLSGLLTAWRCLDVNPELAITIIEASDRIGGDHIWSFNLSDVPEFLQDWVMPFIAYQWERYEVRFPEYSRILEIPYCTGNSATLRACVRTYIEAGRLNPLLGTRIQEVGPDFVKLENGQVLKATCVLDARGFEPNDHVALGYQKFVGLTVKTEQPHGLEYPVIMDATVDQIDGYRFVYCLPFSENELLVEDTYYSDDHDLTEAGIASRVHDYMDGHEWNVETVLRKEKGVLPITLGVSGNVRITQEIGIRGGFYHAVTGYSFPDAVQVADAIALNISLYGGDWNSDVSLYTLSGRRTYHIQKERFFRLLNRMLFRASKPEKRYRVLQRFYRLDQGLIERFYAGDLRWHDKLRILIGKPPVPLHLALYNFSERAFICRERKRQSESDG